MLSLQLAYTVSVTPLSAVPAGEANRRKAMQKTNTFLKIFFNGREVAQTKSKVLTTDFKLNFGSIFRIRITQWPELLKVRKVIRL